ncbi:MAG: hypothetical protein K1Y02_10220 [Candidatus Hydrogenedentes bacterium]|nr:hypothetical protein [Candidatus Hydrogenedentota bacterium]
MLHDFTQAMPIFPTEEVCLDVRDRDILRRLAEAISQAASLPVHTEKAKLWTHLNDLDGRRPMVLIDEVCWNELTVIDELSLRAVHPWARMQEQALRRMLYQWRHFPCDMVVNEHLACPLAIRSTNFSILEEADVAPPESSEGVVSKRYHTQIRVLEDIEAIRTPTVTHDTAATAFHHAAMIDAYEDIIPIKKTGQKHVWFSPWDSLVRWWGVTEALMDFILRPDIVNAAVKHIVDAWLAELEQLAKQNLLDSNCDNSRIGTGGYGFVSEMPGGAPNSETTMPCHMWGSSRAQIFSEVSPEMFWDYALSHELRWLNRWGMTYYGGSEPIDDKVDSLRKIPNLRKVSVSAWSNYERAVEGLGRDYVISHKPNPAILAETSWDPAQARMNLREFLEVAGGECHVEIILKDISTVRNEPSRLWEWAAIAMDEAARFG